MPTATSVHPNFSEVGILSRFLSEGRGELPPSIASYILDLSIPEEDRTRMHELAVRNQDDDLSAAERDELFAYEKAGTILSILKAKSRKVLGVKPKKRPRS